MKKTSKRKARFSKAADRLNYPEDYDIELPTYAGGHDIFDLHNLLGQYHSGQWDPIYAVQSRESYKDVSVEELSAIEDLLEEIIEGKYMQHVPDSFDDSDDDFEEYADLEKDKYIAYDWLPVIQELLSEHKERFDKWNEGASMSGLKGALKSLGQQAQPAPQQPQQTEQQDMGAEIKFKDMFSKDVASWISMEARLLSMNNYGKWKNLDEANDKIDKAIEEISTVLSKAGKAETERIVNEERQELLEEMSSYIPVEQVPDVQQPAMGPVESPQLPDETQPQMGPMGAALTALKKAPMSAMLKKAFEKGAQGWDTEDISDEDPDFKRWKKKQDEKDRLEDEDFREWKKKQPEIDSLEEITTTNAPGWRRGKKAQEESWDTGEVERWIMNDFDMYNKALDIAVDRHQDLIAMAHALEETFFGKIPGIDNDEVDWVAVADHVRTLWRQEYYS